MSRNYIYRRWETSDAHISIENDDDGGDDDDDDDDDKSIGCTAQQNGGVRSHETGMVGSRIHQATTRTWRAVLLHAGQRFVVML